VLWNQF